MAADDRLAPDGSSIALYERLAPMGEPDVIHPAIPAAAEILELGARAGRMNAARHAGSA